MTEQPPTSDAAVPLPIRELFDEAFEDKDPGPDYRPGYKTTEFWLHVGGFVLSVGLGVYGATHDRDIVTGLAVLLGISTQAGYLWGRTAVKRQPRRVG